MNKRFAILSVFAVLTALLTSQCYSFKGITIDPNVNTFYIAPFENNAIDVVPTLAITFAERLRDKVRQESRLNYTDTDPDIEFSGAITGYRVTSEAPQPGETTAFNRLTISVSVEYLNNKKEEEEPLKRTFSFFNDFDSSQNLISIQDDLIDNINDQLAEDIFNWAFNNW